MRRGIAAAAIAGSVLAGAGFGIAYYGPTAAVAQTSSTSSSSSDAPAPPPGDHHGAGLAVAAQAIGISETDLVSAIQSGKTIAQVAQDHGVDPQAVIDAMVADAQSHLSDDITNFVNNTPKDLGRHGPRRGRGADLAVAAQTIGVSVDDLRSALQSGQTVAQVAQAHGVDPQAVIDAIVADAQQHLDQAVADGHLTQAQADDMKTHLSDMATNLVNGTRPAGAPAFGPGPGPGPDGFTS